MFDPVEAGTADLVIIYRLPGRSDIEPTLEGAVSEYTLAATVTETPDGWRHGFVCIAHVAV